MFSPTNTKDKLFTKEFVKSLLIALSLHLISLLIIDVHTFQEIGVFTYPPVSVNINMGTEPQIESMMTSSLQIDDNGSYTLESETPIPPLPKMPPPTIDTRLPHNKALATYKQHFSQIERMPYQDITKPLSFFKSSQININISGDLADKHLLSSPNNTINHLNIYGEFYVSFHVQMDEKTGQIFWHYKESSSNDLDSFAEELLKELQFEPSKDSFITEGKIEFIFLFS